MIARWRPCAALLIGAILAGCGRQAGAADEGEWATVRVNARPLLTNAPILIAEAEGYFARHRIRVEWAELSQSTTQAIPVLAQGKLDVIAGAISSGLLNAIAAGAPIRIVADKGHTEPTACAQSGLVVRRALVDSGAVRSIADLKGRRLAANEVGISSFQLERLLASGGVAFDDLTMVKLPWAANAQALRSGAIDAASVPEPWLTLLVDEGNHLLGQAAPLTPRAQGAVLIFGPTLLRDRPEVGERFLAAYLEGVRRYNEGKSERNVGILAEWLKTEPELLTRMCWPAVHGDGRVDTTSLVDFQRWAVAKGYLRDSATVAEMWDPALVRRAAAMMTAERETAP